FEHFYCPILFIDEDVSLCEGHIVNEAFDDSPRAQIVQRKDVDNFYGSKFEAEFTVLQDFQRWQESDFITNSTLRRKLAPVILAGGKRVDFFVAQKEVPPEFTPVIVEGDVSALIGLKMDFGEALAVQEAGWAVEVGKDLRLPALVSLIKAAYLTCLSLFSYRYVLSSAGRFVGWEILGRFFAQNYSRPKSMVLDTAANFFREYAHMVRPVEGNSFGFQGTISDRTVLACWSGSGFPWAIIVFIRTGSLLHAVMMPVFGHVEAVPTFLGFLSNSNDSIGVRVARLTNEDNRRFWEVGRDSRMQWPKKSIGGMWAD